jgi:H+/gluconate symporter-like permease
VRERATSASTFDPPEAGRGKPAAQEPGFAVAMAPLVVVVAVNLLMSFVVLPRLDLGFLDDERWSGLSLAAVSGVWAVLVALLCAIVTLLLLNRSRLTAVRESMDAGANASVLPVLSVACLVGFGAVVAAMPAFELVRDWVLSIQGGLLVSLAASTNILAALTGSASGGMTIALDALGATYVALAEAQGLDPAVLHRVAAMAAGTLDSLPHNGAIVTLLAVCGSTHKESYFHLAMAAIVGPVVALVAVIALGNVFGSF